MVRASVELCTVIDGVVDTVTTVVSMLFSAFIALIYRLWKWVCGVGGGDFSELFAVRLSTISALVKVLDAITEQLPLLVVLMIAFDWLIVLLVDELIFCGDLVLYSMTVVPPGLK